MKTSVSPQSSSQTEEHKHTQQCKQQNTNCKDNTHNCKPVDDSWIAHLLVMVGLVLHTINCFMSPNSNYLWAIHALYTLFLVIKFSKTKQSSLSEYTPPPQSAKNTISSLQNANICKICHRIKPPRYYHCRKCNICIYRMNHHCAWLSNCVGQFNGKLYVQVLFCFLFIAGECILSYLSNLITFVTEWSNGITNESQEINNFLALKILIFCINSFVAYQSFRMLRDYVQSIDSNQTLIETYKGVKGIEKKTLIEKWIEILGEKWWSWMLPSFAGVQNGKIFEEVIAIQNKNRKFVKLEEEALENQNKKYVKSLKVQEYKYADEYIYGPDDQDLFFQFEDKQTENKEKQA